MPKTRKDVDYVGHEEPWCRDECTVDDPHRHGFSCDRNCPKCSAICHPDCPAYEEANIKFLEAVAPQGDINIQAKEHQDDA